MNENGIVRNVDDLGRIVVPKEIRCVFEVAIITPFEFSIFMHSNIWRL